MPRVSDAIEVHLVEDNRGDVELVRRALRDLEHDDEAPMPNLLTTHLSS